MLGLPYRPEESPFKLELTKMLTPEINDGKITPSVVPEEYATCLFVAGDRAKSECGNDGNCRLVNMEAVEFVGERLSNIFRNSGWYETKYFSIPKQFRKTKEKAGRIRGEGEFHRDVAQAVRVGGEKCSKVRADVSKYRGTYEEYIQKQREKKDIGGEEQITKCEAVLNSNMRNLQRCAYKNGRIRRLERRYRSAAVESDDTLNQQLERALTGKLHNAGNT